MVSFLQFLIELLWNTVTKLFIIQFQFIQSPTSLSQYTSLTTNIPSFPTIIHPFLSPLPASLADIILFLSLSSFFHFRHWFTIFFYLISAPSSCPENCQLALSLRSFLCPNSTFLLLWQAFFQSLVFLAFISIVFKYYYPTIFDF